MIITIETKATICYNFHLDASNQSGVGALHVCKRNGEVGLLINFKVHGNVFGNLTIRKFRQLSRADGDKIDVCRNLIDLCLFSIFFGEIFFRKERKTTKKSYTFPLSQTVVKCFIDKKIRWFDKSSAQHVSINRYATRWNHVLNNK